MINQRFHSINNIYCIQGTNQVFLDYYIYQKSSDGYGFILSYKNTTASNFLADKVKISVNFSLELLVGIPFSTLDMLEDRIGSSLDDDNFKKNFIIRKLVNMYYLFRKLSDSQLAKAVSTIANRKFLSDINIFREIGTCQLKEIAAIDAFIDGGYYVYLVGQRTTPKQLIILKQ